jgi:hypothetical protein
MLVAGRGGSTNGDVAVAEWSRFAGLTTVRMRASKAARLGLGPSWRCPESERQSRTVRTPDRTQARLRLSHPQDVEIFPFPDCVCRACEHVRRSRYCGESAPAGQAGADGVSVPLGRPREFDRDQGPK